MDGRDGSRSRESPACSWSWACSPWPRSPRAAPALVGAVLAGPARRAPAQARGIRRPAGRWRRPPACSPSPGGAVSTRTHTGARVALPALALLAALTAACGGGAGHPRTTAAQRTASQTSSASTDVDNGLQLANKPEDCLAKVQRTRAVDRALREAAQLKRMAAPLDRSSMGTPALQQATDRFLTHLTTSKLDSYYQNRLIDKAASAVAFACEQCFQMLEASRPIPA